MNVSEDKRKVLEDRYGCVVSDEDGEQVVWSEEWETCRWKDVDGEFL